MEEAGAARGLGPLETVLREGFLADAHADTLMWNRDLTVRSRHGHVDFPRLAEAGAKLQCFTVVTRGYPLVDGLGLLARWRGWGEAGRRGPWARALWQIERLECACAGSRQAAGFVRCRADLEGNARAGRLSALLGVEGAHATEGDLSRVEALWQLGARFMSLTHLSNNAFGGCSTPGMPQRGLSGLGRETLGEMQRVGMALDLAHASSRTIEQSLARWSGPVFCSHTGLRSATPNWRNLEDEIAGEIARRGGVVCVIFGTVYLGGRGLEHLLRHLERGLRVAGEDALGFGSDFDGLVPLPKGMSDARGLRVVVQRLLDRGWPRRVVEKVMGGNLRRFFSGQVLPPGASQPGMC